MHDDADAGMTAQDGAGGACMVQVDVREHQVRHGRQRLTVHGERGFERLEA